MLKLNLKAQVSSFFLIVYSSLTTHLVNIGSSECILHFEILPFELCILKLCGYFLTIKVLFTPMKEKLFQSVILWENSPESDTFKDLFNYEALLKNFNMFVQNFFLKATKQRWKGEW